MSWSSRCLHLTAYGLWAAVLTSGCDHRLVVGANPIPDLTTGLVAFWTFESPPLTAIVDVSGNGNHGQERSFSVTDYVPGVHGSALGFGQAGWFEVPDSPSLDTISRALTIACWISAPMLAPGRGVVLERRADPDPSYALTLESGVLSLATGTATCQAPGALTALPWSHLAAIFDGATVQLFIDGAMVESCPTTGALTATLAPLGVGASLSAPVADKLRATLDDVAVWSRALDPSAVRALATGAMPIEH